MKVIIMGCGRVGEQLARLMTQEGHAVAVIDQDAAALARLGDDFHGIRIKGIGFDRDVLIKAGIEQADAFAAASASDDANVVAARIARQIFHVPRVVARLFDPRRAEIYQRLGLLTISSTTWGAERFRELITHSELDPLMTFGDGDVCLLSLDTPPQLVGRQIRQLLVPGEIQVIAVTRQGRAFVPLTGSEIQPHDVIHLTVMASSMERLKQLVGWETGGLV